MTIELCRVDLVITLLCDVGAVSPIVSDAQELVHHGLVCPLGQQGGHRVLPPV